ncbi:hypothetical protein NVP1253O_27 [Vibrio phage 1.253.O._10N.286.45.B12]|nr:hypothetical protein NVP1235O_27 [Vibrio phage 1.235.O._10N.261.52.B2]AUR98551.1 hypothetical protein NVP1253O_27 [Vibrio phage 1.253.O._10N.286.45.B12]
MARPSGPKTRCGGRWTEARFNSFIKGALRGATRKWAPIQDCLKNARTRRGFYLCAECKQEVPATVKVGTKRKKNAIVDHIVPIVDPAVGFTNWHDCVERMFCEEDNLQVMCLDCHLVKCQEEKDIEKARKAGEKIYADDQ